MVWRKFLATTAGLITAAPALAATLIETQDGEGMRQSMWIDGPRMRVEQTGASEYMLIDHQREKMYVVNPEANEVLDMSSMLAGKNSGAAPKIQAELKHKGGGPSIAGYPTEHYELIVNGQKCSDEYLSREALADTGAADLFDAMAKMTAGETVGAAAMMMDPCDLADLTLTDAYRERGMPMRVMDDDGMLNTEVVRIDKNAGTPQGGFDVPSGYEVVDFQQMMQQAMPPGAMPGMPEGVTPEQMQQMMQEMMKRMPPQQ